MQRVTPILFSQMIQRKHELSAADVCCLRIDSDSATKDNTRAKKCLANRPRGLADENHPIRMKTVKFIVRHNDKITQDQL